MGISGPMSFPGVGISGTMPHHWLGGYDQGLSMSRRWVCSGGGYVWGVGMSRLGGCSPP